MKAKPALHVSNCQQNQLMDRTKIEKVEQNYKLLVQTKSRNHMFACLFYTMACTQSITVYMVCIKVAGGRSTQRTGVVNCSWWQYNGINFPQGHACMLFPPLFMSYVYCHTVSYVLCHIKFMLLVDTFYMWCPFRKSKNSYKRYIPCKWNRVPSAKTYSFLSVFRDTESLGPFCVWMQISLWRDLFDCATMSSALLRFICSLEHHFPDNTVIVQRPWHSAIFRSCDLDADLSAILKEDI